MSQIIAPTSYLQLKRVVAPPPARGGPPSGLTFSSSLSRTLTCGQVTRVQNMKGNLIGYQILDFLLSCNENGDLCRNTMLNL